jgi:hypothetical protein
VVFNRIAMADSMQPDTQPERLEASTDAILPVTYADVEAAADRLKGQAHRTPVMTSTTIDRQTGSQVFLSARTFSALEPLSFEGHTTRWCSCQKSNVGVGC